MDQKRLIDNSDDEVLNDIISQIKNKQNFLLSGGAGSGKTYSLVQVLDYITNTNPKEQIACITYTNAAADEILSRVQGKNLYVSTIHEFLWSHMQQFQNEIKLSIKDLVVESKIKVPSFNDKCLTNKIIQYKEYTQIENGIISHKEVLLVANYMFQKYSKLQRIMIDRYPFILVDEYQDTDPLVIKILLEYLQQNAKKCVIGLFGDEMQAIYDEGIGNINSYILSGSVKKIEKIQNRRNPQSVIDIGNKIRIDNLVQRPSSDLLAPNMDKKGVKKGSALFMYSKHKKTTDELKKLEFFKDWDFGNTKETKELRLTHNLIANEAGYGNLMRVYDKDPLIGFKNKFQEYIRKNNIDINELDSFEKVIKSVNWRYANKKPYDGRLHLEVSLEDNEFSKGYNLVKDWEYSKVKRIWANKDMLIDDLNSNRGSMQDQLIKHLYKIQELIALYSEKRFNEFLRKTEYTITSINDKQELKDNIEKLKGNNQLSISEVIELADTMNLCKKDDHFNHFIKEHEYIYERVKDISYNEFINLYNYLAGYMPFSTQHKTKGREFKNVLVVLDNGQWNKYNFEYLFNNSCVNDKKFNPKVEERTRKLFYVCCTRTKENLIVYYPSPNNAIINGAEIMFGKDNCINLDDINS